MLTGSYFNVNYEVYKHEPFSSQRLVTFLLAQKSNQKRAKNPNASPHKAIAPLAGFLGSRTHRLVLRTSPWIVL